MLKKSTQLSFLLLGILSVSAGNVFASPTITSVSGALAKGQSLTITGSSFGTKSNAAPIKFDTFENGSNGATLASKQPEWKSYTGDAGNSFTNSVAHAGGYSVGHHVTNGEVFSTNYFTYSPASNQTFVSYWYLIKNLTGCSGPVPQTIVKMSRITSTAAAGGGGGGTTNGIYNGAGDTTFGGTYDICSGGTPYLAYVADPSAAEHVIGYFGSMPAVGTWHRVDMYKSLSTPGVANGTATVKVYGVQEMNGIGNQMTVGSGQSFQLNNVWMGGADGSDSNHDYYVYFDDMYIDNTQARVEVCDSSTWASRTACEIQPATSWSSSSITINGNTGAISANSNRYLYVVDSNGQVNPNGYAISVGAGSSSTPAAPTLRLM